MQRWIIHVDMDAFFAAVEQRDNPQLRGKPVIVGGSGPRGVVATASYEARTFGVHSAMSSVEARRRCPQAIFITADHHRYARVSRQIRKIMDDFSPLIEPLSLDEAFLDVSGMEWLYASPVDIARRIKERIRQEVGLTASAGIGPNKFLAKVASDLQKPDGLVFVRPEEVERFLNPLAVSRLWGVGAVTAKVLQDHGIKTIGQLAKAEPHRLAEWLGGTAAGDILQLARGLDNRPVVVEHAPKSVGNEETYEQDLFDPEVARTRLLGLAVHVAWRLRLLGLSARTITVKIRWASFKTITRSHTLAESTCLDETLFSTAMELMSKAWSREGIRLLGLTASGFSTGVSQCSLFGGEQEKQLAVAATVDKLRLKFGETAVLRGRLLLDK